MFNGPPGSNVTSPPFPPGIPVVEVVSTPEFDVNVLFQSAPMQLVHVSPNPAGTLDGIFFTTADAVEDDEGNPLTAAQDSANLALPGPNPPASLTYGGVIQPGATVLIGGIGANFGQPGFGGIQVVGVSANAIVVPSTPAPRVVQIPSVMDASLSTEAATRFFADGQDEVSAAPNTLLSWKGGHAMTGDSSDGWVVSYGPDSKSSLPDSPWKIAVKANAAVSYDANRHILHLPAGSVALNQGIYTVVQSKLEDDIFIVVLRSQNDPRNVRAFNAAGVQVWQIDKLPALWGGQGSYYLDAYNDPKNHMLIVMSLTCSARVDPRTGRTLNIFTSR